MKAHAFVENVINESFNVSVINRIEVLGHESATQDLTDFMNLANTYQLTEIIEKQTISLRKQKKIKLPDAIIAATALVHNFIIISRNVKDFTNIEGLNYVNPYEL
ncbi:MAG: type II toxin-antitoxin system VapC family toxin [Emticicia sp.]